MPDAFRFYRKSTAPSNVNKVMDVTAHLSELRARLLWALASTAVAALALIPWWRILISWVLFPLRYARSPHPDWHVWSQALWSPMGSSHLVTLSPVEPLFTVTNVILAAAVVSTAPIWLYQFWAFFSPVLPWEHRRWVAFYLIGTVFSFWVGAAVAFLGFLPFSLHFLLRFAQGIFLPQVRAGYYLGFITSFTLASGTIFSTPALLVVGVKIGWLKVSVLKKGRRWALLFSAVITALIVPSQDPLTLAVVTGTLYALFEGALVLAGLIHPLPLQMRPAEKERG